MELNMKVRDVDDCEDTMDMEILAIGSGLAFHPTPSRGPPGAELGLIEQYIVAILP